MVWGWPLYFWMAAQGSILLFICIVIVYAWLVNRWEAQESAAGRPVPKAWTRATFPMLGRVDRMSIPQKSPLIDRCFPLCLRNIDICSPSKKCKEAVRYVNFSH